MPDTIRAEPAAPPGGPARESTARIDRVAVVNVVTTEHRLIPRINGTAPCWNPDYSPADCPWGPKD